MPRLTVFQNDRNCTAAHRERHQSKCIYTSLLEFGLEALIPGHEPPWSVTDTVSVTEQVDIQDSRDFIRSMRFFSTIIIIA